MRHALPTFLWVLLCGSVLAGCFLDRAGTKEGCVGELAPACNSAGEALEGCSASTPTSMVCDVGCTPGQDFCWTCDPSDTTLTCNAAGTALEGCGADGRANVDNCLSGCTPGDSECGPCMTGAVVCDGTDLVSCVAAMEQREICRYACVVAPAPAHCTDCTPSASECHGMGATSAAVECNADGTIASSVPCAIGCSVVAGTASCQDCTPGSPDRCNPARDAILSCDGSGQEVPAPCSPGDVCVESAGTATCETPCVGSCTGGVLTECPSGATTRCDFGCNAARDGCAFLVPSNVGTIVAMDAGTAVLSVGTGSTPEVLLFFTDDGRIVTIDTSDDSIDTEVRAAGGRGGDNGSGIFYDEVAQGAGEPGLAVWAVRSLTVGSNGAIYFVGSDYDDPAAVLLVEGDVSISGLVSATGLYLSGEDTSYRGPAAAAGGDSAGSAGNGTGGGGGGGGNDGGDGGGFGSRGGADGSGTRTAGNTYGGANLEPLLGGSGGGGGASGASVGGGGGGALQISAGGRFTVAGTGVVDASGTPGSGASGHGGGGGGGSGGAILLEALSIDIMGTAGAPGGGGGGGRHGGGNGSTGVRWDPAAGQLRSLGGAPASGGGGAGADGSDLDGSTGTAGSDNSDDGGGGGGAGRIRLNALTVGAVRPTGSALTPSLVSGITTAGVVRVR